MEAASIPNPIHKVLSTFQKCGVRALLMGGQACVLYGAAEFSRDVDFAIVAEADNLERLKQALKLLEAEVIAVPSLSLEHLLRGHAVHFRCRSPETQSLRVDVMAKMRGVDAFDSLWQRRTTIETERGISYEVLSLPDLVQAKKTQRDKDWPMIRRLIEADVANDSAEPTEPRLSFWLREARTPSILIELARRYPIQCASLVPQRPALKHALKADEDELTTALAEEECRQRETDRSYWRPLRSELEEMRRQKRLNSDEAGSQTP